MILLGFRTRTRTQGTGTFHCPREEGNRRYRVVVLRRWVRVGRVPVVPLEELASFVECHSCHSTYNQEVLEGTTLRPVEDMLTATLRRAVPAVLGDDVLTSRDRREAVIVLQRYANVPYGSRDLDLDLRGSAEAPIDTELRDLAASLNDHGRDAVLDAAVQLVTRDGPPRGEGIEAVKRVAFALSLPCDRVRRAIDRRLERVAIAS